MTRNTTRVRMPGSRLRQFASALFRRATAERYLYSAIADLQHEAGLAAGKQGLHRLVTMC